MTGEPPFRAPASPLPGRSASPVRVLVVDDSALTRRVLMAALNGASDIEVVGSAANGQECFAKVEELQPDVVTLDVEMPGMDGLAVLRQLMARSPLPVVMVSYLTHEGAEATVRALLDGAVDFVPKPGGPILGSVVTLRDELVRKVREAARARPRVGRPRLSTTTHRLPPVSVSPRPAPPPPARTPLRASDGFERLVILGASTGGPQALQAVVSDLHPDGRTAYVIVQHMPDGMTTVLADLLASASPLLIREARQNDRLAPDVALLAPGDWHLRFGPRGTIELDQGPKVHWVRPSVDVALLSAAEVYGSRIVTAVLTGMGSDGADGAVAVKQAGGTVIAEDKSTCVVYGMPKAVAQRGAAEHIVPLPQVAPTIRQLLAGTGRTRQPSLV
ncbi:MAG: chemotaxis response regulator protein-glutamate methylesterase [Chloroflexi bacterium]|nr:chemotaxis response regulator protein-glutamate methylesterase [Chloroflexota bacterium]